MWSFHDYISSYHAVKKVYLLVYFIIRQPTSDVFPKDAYDRSEHTLEFSLAASSESYVSNLRRNGPPPWFCYKYKLSPLVCYLTFFSSIKYSQIWVLGKNMNLTWQMMWKKNFIFGESCLFIRLISWLILFSQWNNNSW